MTHDVDRQLQDFLDGRLSAADREAFEARLADDSDLARRVNEYREIREALREDGPALSPGFYTRARARFEASAPAARSGWSRLVSWEAAGLAAAAVLVAAVFLPQLVDRRLPGPMVARQEAADAPSPPVPAEDSAREEAPPRREQTTLRQDAGAATADGFAEPPAVEAPPVEGGLRDEAQKIPARIETGAREKEKKSIPTQQATPGDREAEGFELDAPEEPTGPAAKSESADTAAEHERRRATDAPPRRVREFAPAPEPTASPSPAQEPQASLEADVATIEERAPTGKAGSDVARETALAGLPDPEQPSAAPAGRKLSAERSAWAPEPGVLASDLQILRGIVLPADAMAPGVLLTIDTEDAWNAWIGSPAGRGFADAEYDSVQRLVLIGPRGRPFECERIPTRVSAGSYVLMVGPAGAPSEATGCAVFLPRDGRAVRVEER